MLGRVWFLPTLYYTQLRHSLGLTRKWYDHVDNGVVLGALPMKQYVSSLHSVRENC